jgi:hypothetical protein
VKKQKRKGMMEVQSINHQNSERARRYYLIDEYANFITQPLGSSRDIILTDEIMSFCRANKDCTIEDAINAGVKLKQK